MEKNFKSFCLILATTVIIQSSHMIEHIAQIYQLFVLGRDPLNAQGLIGQFDIETVHFFYDAVFTFGFWLILIKIPETAKNNSPGFYRLLYAAVLIQSYHLCEHILKYFQYFQTGMEGTPGFLGNFIFPPVLHFGLNLIGTIVLWTTYIGFKFHKTCPMEAQKQQMQPPIQPM